MSQLTSQSSMREPAAAPPGSRRVWGRVGIYLSGNAVSLLGDQVFFIAVVWTAAKLGGAAAVTWVTLAESVPRALAMIFGGVICDTLGPRVVLLRTTAVRIAVLATAVVLAMSAPAVWLLILVALLEGTMLGLGTPSFGTMLPRIVSDEQLGKANSIRTMAGQFAPILGSPFGAWLVADGHLSAALAVVCGGCVVSYVCLSTVTRGITAPGAAGGPVWSKLGDGFKLLHANGRLRWLFLSALCIDLAFAWPLNPGLPVVVISRGWTVAAVGMLIACFGAGVLVSAGLGAVLDERIPVSVRFVGGGAGIAASLLAMILAPSLPLMAVASAAVGVFSGQNSPAAVTLFQRATPAGRLGVSMSMLALCGIGAAPFAYAIFGALADVTGPTTAWICCAVLAFTGPLAGLRALRL